MLVANLVGVFFHKRFVSGLADESDVLRFGVARPFRWAVHVFETEITPRVGVTHLANNCEPFSAVRRVSEISGKSLTFICWRRFASLSNLTAASRRFPSMTTSFPLSVVYEKGSYY